MPQYISRSPEETKKIATDLAKSVKKGSIICLFGDLGAGKTVFTKGFAHALGFNENVIKSPTYTYLKTYKNAQNRLYHFDFYRINETDDLIIHDLNHVLLDSDGFFIIEWPERIKEQLPRTRFDIHIDYIDENSRKISINEH